MKIKTLELIDITLDWAVCEATGLLAAYPRVREDFALQWSSTGNRHLHPSTDWSQGGPIIEREKIGSLHEARGVWSASTKWEDPAKVFYGKTKLIAAMRCYVAAKLGDELEIPNELIGELKP